MNIFRKNVPDKDGLAKRSLFEEIEASQSAFYSGFTKLLNQRNHAIARGQEDLAARAQADVQGLLDLYSAWKQGNSLRALLADSQESPRQEVKHQSRCYLVGSLFLKRCYRFLLQGAPPSLRDSSEAPEWACAVTGLRMADTLTMDEIIPVKMLNQSAGGVCLSVESLEDVLINLHINGHALHAVFHSHRMKGPHGTVPSPIDRKTQANYLEQNYPAIQAIFSEDGYIRFWSVEKSFQVEVYGKGIDLVADRLYHIRDVGPAHQSSELPALISTTPGGV
jgi:hypothetical protein